MTQNQPIDLTLVICTFRREELLRQALASVIAQEIPDGARFDVVVVDNSDDASAAPLVRSMNDESPFDIRFVEAHPPNISVARNAGVRAASSAHVAFLDDDQQLQAGWLTAVAEGLRAYPHDVLFGAVEPDFEAPERATAATRQLFTRRHDAPAGHDLFALGAGKTHGLALATNNCVFRAASALIDPEPFDPAFGNGGGEDYDLFCRLQRRGCRFGWLPAARAREFVPASRCDPAYLRRRFFAGGQAFAAAIAGASRRPGATRWGLRARAAAQAGVLALQAPVHALRGRDAFIDYSYRWAGVLGKLSFGGLYPVYREADALRRSAG